MVQSCRTVTQLFGTFLPSCGLKLLYYCHALSLIHWYIFKIQFVTEGRQARPDKFRLLKALIPSSFRTPKPPRYAVVIHSSFALLPQSIHCEVGSYAGSSSNALPSTPNKF